MSGRQAPTATTATETLFQACQDLHHAAMANALNGGADVHAMDEEGRRPLGVFIKAWQCAPTRPPPTPFVELLAAYGVDLACPEGGDDARHTFDFLQCKDEEMPLLEALSDAGMDFDPRVDQGELLTRVVRNRAPDMLFCLLGSDFDVDPDAQDEDNQTALHALVDARVFHSGQRRHLVRDDDHSLRCLRHGCHP